MTPIAELRHVSRSFVKDRQVIPVLQDVNLSIEPNEIICLVGESGCGKTTTGKIIVGLLDPSQGEMRIDGQPIASHGKKEQSALRRQLQLVHQDPFASLNPAHTIGDILSFPLRRHKMVSGRGSMRRRIWELLTMVDLTPPGDIVHKFPHQLSGGQQQRVGLARALATSPQVLLFDEPFSALDPLIRRDMQDEVIRLRGEVSTTMVFITHDLQEALRIGDRIAIMRDGRFVQVGTPAEVVGAPADEYVRNFVRDVPRSHVVSVDTVMGPPAARHGGSVPAATKIRDVMRVMLDTELPVAVTDDDGRVIGSIDRTAALAVVVGEPD